MATTVARALTSIGVALIAIVAGVIVAALAIIEVEATLATVETRVWVAIIVAGVTCVIAATVAEWEQLQ